MRRPQPWRGRLALIVLPLIAACDGGTDPPVAANVSVSLSSVDFAAVGETQQLTASVVDRNGQVIAGASVTWASNDNSVATVSTSGLVTAVGNGSATVTATSGGATGATGVTVAQVLVVFEVSPSADTLFSFGETLQLTARALDANDNVIPDLSIAWSSADEAVATVDADGLVTAIGNGSADITATGGGSTATAALTVSQRLVRIALSPSADTLLAVGDTVRLTAQPLDANGNHVTSAIVEWSSADEAIATVDSAGLVTAIGNGSTNVTAAAEEVSEAAAVTVSQVLVEMDVIPAATALLALGDTVRLVAAGLDTNGNTIADVSFMWTSKNDAVATVDSAGLVTAIRTGSTDVFATTGELRDSAGVTVAQLASEVRVTPAVDTLDAVGDTVRLTAMAVDRNGNEVEDTDYIWSAPHPSVVTVDSNGLVTARGVGTGEIRVRATRAGADYIGIATITVRGTASGTSPPS